MLFSTLPDQSEKADSSTRSYDKVDALIDLNFNGLEIVQGSYPEEFTKKSGPHESPVHPGYGLDLLKDHACEASNAMQI